MSFERKFKYFPSWDDYFWSFYLWKWFLRDFLNSEKLRHTGFPDFPTMKSSDKLRKIRRGKKISFIFGTRIVFSFLAALFLCQGKKWCGESRRNLKKKQRNNNTRINTKFSNSCACPMTKVPRGTGSLELFHRRRIFIFLCLLSCRVVKEMKLMRCEFKIHCNGYLVGNCTWIAFYGVDFQNLSFLFIAKILMSFEFLINENY